jgi:hypothetical protein
VNTCGDCPRWPAARSHSSQALERAFAKQASERAFAGQALERAHARILSGGRHLELWKVGALTCTGGNGLTRLGLWRANSAPRPAVHERCQRVRFGGAPASRQSCGASLPPGAKSAVEGGSRSARSRQRVVKRAAVGGPDDRKVVRRRPRKNASAKSARDPTGDLEIERWRVSHSARWVVSEGDVCHGCSWRETSVVEASSRHLDSVIEGWPQGRTRHGVERGRRPVARNGASGHCPTQQGCYGQAKAERQEPTPR